MPEKKQDAPIQNKSPSSNQLVWLCRMRLRRNWYYDVGPDGERFLLNQLRGEPSVPSAVLVRGWEDER